MKNLPWPIVALFFVILFVSCQSSGDQLDTMERMALKKGSLIADSTQNVLAANLKKAIQNEGLLHAIQYCNVEAMPLTREIEAQFDVSIKRTTLKARNPKNSPNRQEMSILREYDAMVNEGRKVRSHTHWVNEETLLYTQPIMINSPLCLNCHGQQGIALTDTLHAFIRNKYPNDEAIGYELGDLRGMWSIAFKKEKLKSMVEDH